MPLCDQMLDGERDPGAVVPGHQGEHRPVRAAAEQDDRHPRLVRLLQERVLPLRGGHDETVDLPTPQRLELPPLLPGSLSVLARSAV
jgi:hypothetical protein